MRPGRILPVLFLFLAAFAGSCDHTVLSGEVLGPRSLAVGHTAELVLAVPGELDGIHGEYWQAEPEGLVRLTPGQGRSVRVTALRPGSVVLRVFGFYRQTNPQPITEATLTVIPLP